MQLVLNVQTLSVETHPNQPYWTLAIPYSHCPAGSGIWSWLPGHQYLPYRQAMQSQMHVCKFVHVEPAARMELIK